MKKIKWLSVLVICICLAGCGKEGSSSGNTPVKEASEVSEVSEAAEQPVKEEANAGKEEDGKTEDNQPSSKVVHRLQRAGGDSHKNDKSSQLYRRNAPKHITCSEPIGGGEHHRTETLADCCSGDGQIKNEE